MFCKRVSLEISQNSQENTCARSLFFRKFTGNHLCQSLHFNKVDATLLKKRLWYRCFPMNFAKVLRTSFLQNTSGRLLLTRVVNPISLKISYKIFSLPNPQNNYFFSLYQKILIEILTAMYRSYFHKNITQVKLIF